MRDAGELEAYLAECFRVLIRAKRRKRQKIALTMVLAVIVIVLDLSGAI